MHKHELLVNIRPDLSLLQKIKFNFANELVYTAPPRGVYEEGIPCESVTVPAAVILAEPGHNATVKRPALWEGVRRER